MSSTSTGDWTTINFYLVVQVTLAVCRVKAAPSFLSYFSQVPGIEPTTSGCVVKHQIEVNSAAVNINGFSILSVVPAITLLVCKLTLRWNSALQIPIE